MARGLAADVTWSRGDEERPLLQPDPQPAEDRLRNRDHRAGRTARRARASGGEPDVYLFWQKVRAVRVRGLMATRVKISSPPRSTGLSPTPALPRPGAFSPCFTTPSDSGGAGRRLRPTAGLAVDRCSYRGKTGLPHEGRGQAYSPENHRPPRIFIMAADGFVAPTAVELVGFHAVDEGVTPCIAIPG